MTLVNVVGIGYDFFNQQRRRSLAENGDFQARGRFPGDALRVITTECPDYVPAPDRFRNLLPRAFPSTCQS
jgi:hypothetical protein